MLSTKNDARSSSCSICCVNGEASEDLYEFRDCKSALAKAYLEPHPGSDTKEVDDDENRGNDQGEQRVQKKWGPIHLKSPRVLRHKPEIGLRKEKHEHRSQGSSSSPPSSNKELGADQFDRSTSGSKLGSKPKPNLSARSAGEGARHSEAKKRTSSRSPDACGSPQGGRLSPTTAFGRDTGGNNSRGSSGSSVSKSVFLSKTRSFKRIISFRRDAARPGDSEDRCGSGCTSSPYCYDHFRSPNLQGEPHQCDYRPLSLSFLGQIYRRKSLGGKVDQRRKLAQSCRNFTSSGSSGRATLGVAPAPKTTSGSGRAIPSSLSSAADLREPDQPPLPAGHDPPCPDKEATAAGGAKDCGEKSNQHRRHNHQHRHPHGPDEDNIISLADNSQE